MHPAYYFFCFDLCLMSKSCFHYCPCTTVVPFKSKYWHKKYIFALTTLSLQVYKPEWSLPKVHGHQNFYHIYHKHLFACVIHFGNIANSYQITKFLLVLNVGNVLMSDQRALESHMRVYTREPLFACLQYNTYCYNTFSTKSKDNPKTHQKHVNAWEKPCSGKECGKSLVTTKMLKDTWPFIPGENILPKKLLGWNTKSNNNAFTGLFSGFSITISLS